MKKLGGISIVVLFFLIVAGLITYAIVKNNAGVPTGNQPQRPVTLPVAQPSTASVELNAPAELAKTCYSWYVKAYITELHRTNETSYHEGVLSCFTNDFAAKWGDIVENTDSDPVLVANDYADSWASNVSASVVSASDTEATVTVTLGKGDETKRLTATLTKTPSGWRISNSVEAH